MRAMGCRDKCGCAPFESDSGVWMSRLSTINKYLQAACGCEAQVRPES